MTNILSTRSKGYSIQLQKLIVTEGYVQLSPLEYNFDLDELTSLMDKLDTLRLPVPFVFLYDEFWLLFVRIHSVIENILGKDYSRS